MIHAGRVLHTLYTAEEGRDGAGDWRVKKSSSLSLLALGADVMHPDVMHQWDPIHSAGYFGYSGHVIDVLWLQYIYGVE